MMIMTNNRIGKIFKKCFTLFRVASFFEKISVIRSPIIKRGSTIIDRKEPYINVSVIIITSVSRKLSIYLKQKRRFIKL